MTRDNHLLVMRVPKASAAASLPQNGSGTLCAPSGAGAAPSCVWLMCDRPATKGDLCAAHWELSKDLR